LTCSGDIRRIHDNDVSADGLKLTHELRTPDDMDGFQPRAFAKAITHRPTPELGGVLHHQSA